MCRRARLLTEHGRRTEAIRLLTVSLSRQGTDVDILADLGHQLLKVQNFVQAEQIFRRLREQDKRSSKALMGLAEALGEQGRAGEALQVLASVDDAGPKDECRQLRKRYTSRLKDR